MATTPTTLGPVLAPYRPFPRAFTVYYQKTPISSKCLLRDDASLPLFAVSIPTYMAWTPGTITLHNGTSTKDPPPATGTEGSGVGAHSVIAIHPPADSGASDSIEHMRLGMGKATIRSFSIEVGNGKDMRREYFEWRGD